MKQHHILTVSAVLITASIVLTMSTAHSEGLAPLDRVFVWDKMSTKSKDAIAEFRRLYRERNERELAGHDEAARAELLTSFERCLDYSYAADIRGANELLRKLDSKYQNEPVILWHLAVNYFLLARRLHEDDADGQAKVFRKGVEKSKQCLDIDDTNPDCWLAYAASKGALSLAEGIFETLSEISGVGDAMHRAYDILQTEKDPYPMAPWGVDSKHVAVGALAEFYRLVPDSWIFGVLAGVQGDKKKAWFYANQMPVQELGSANIVGRSALCHGAESDNQKLIERGISVVARGVNYELVHPFDESEYRRLARLYNAIGDLADPEPDDYFELGCHEFGNDDDEALEKKSTN
jgi:hypothetical protein